MGVETPQPVINDLCRRLNFTNEGGVGGSIRLLKNITGPVAGAGVPPRLGCRRARHELGGVESALRRRAAAGRVDQPRRSRLHGPGDMPQAIREFCRRTGQTSPANEGAVIRCALESLALKYRQVLGWLEQLDGGRLETIHIVGGGAQNRRLCQSTADACGRRVLAGPVEATATGNIAMQAIADGALASVAQAREVIRRSFSVEEYQPQDTAAWDEAFASSRALCR